MNISPALEARRDELLAALVRADRPLSGRELRPTCPGVSYHTFWRCLDMLGRSGLAAKRRHRTPGGIAVLFHATDAGRARVARPEPEPGDEDPADPGKPSPLADPRNRRRIWRRAAILRAAALGQTRPHGAGWEVTA